MRMFEHLKEGDKYKVMSRPPIRIVRYTPGSGEYSETVVIPSSTKMAVLRVNEKSVRVELKFRDRDKASIICRIPFEQNPDQYDIEPI